MQKQEIILIGPIGVGKSTIAELLSIRTGLPRCSMDEHRWRYFDEIGYDWGLAKEAHIRGGFWGLYHYWKPFEAHAVQRLLEDFTHCIFDFGGSQSVYEEEQLFQQVQACLAPYSHVILLMPVPDRDESARILHARNDYASDDQRAVNDLFIHHHSNYDLAKHTVFTQHKDPEQVSNEVYQWVMGHGGLY